VVIVVRFAVVRDNLLRCLALCFRHVSS
jgi:hypothetical protein